MTGVDDCVERKTRRCVCVFANRRSEKRNSSSHDVLYNLASKLHEVGLVDLTAVLNALERTVHDAAHKGQSSPSANTNARNAHRPHVTLSTHLFKPPSCVSASTSIMYCSATHSQICSRVTPGSPATSKYACSNAARCSKLKLEVSRAAAAAAASASASSSRAAMTSETPISVFSSAMVRGGSLEPRRR